MNSRQATAYMYLAGQMLIGFSIGWFLFRNKGTQAKVISGIVGAVSFPIILYLTVGRICFWNCPPPASVHNFLATYGFVDNYERPDDSLKGPVKNDAGPNTPIPVEP